MGEIADMCLDGTMDPETGEFNFDGEDGPGWPMTAEEAAEYSRAIRGGGRPTKRASVQDIITGKWLDIAIAVAGGVDTVSSIARGLHDPKDAMGHTKNVVATNVEKMLAAGLLHRSPIRPDALKLTKRGKRQLANSRAPG